MSTDTNPLLSLTQTLARYSNRDELLADYVALWCRLTGADSCDILFKDASESLMLKASTIVPESTNRIKLGKGVGLTGFVMQSNEPLYLGSGVTKDPRFAKYPGVDYGDCESEAVFPLRGYDETVPYGVLLIRRDKKWRFSAREKQRFQEMAAVTGHCLRGFTNAFQAGGQNNRLGALSEVSRTITTSPYLEEILQLLVHLTAQQFNYRVCTVRLLDETRGELVLRATQAAVKAYQRKRAIKLGESIAGRAIDQNQPQIVRDVLQAEDYIGHDLAEQQGLRSMICVPLMVQEKPIGVLSCYTGEVRDFPPDEIKALETLAKQAAFAIEHAKLQVRNTLMQEMHHRVKNNLQQVASLLRLQMHMSRYENVEQALADTLNRILAIASVHDLLSREDLDHVGLLSIAEALVHHQQCSFILPDRKIRFQIRGDDITLGMNQATQIALVLNELIANAIEHGFAESKEGEIHVSIEATDDDVSLWISNSGDQLPEGFDPSNSSSLGLKIVDSLAKSLGGKFSMRDVMGWTVAEVKFARQYSD